MASERRLEGGEKVSLVAIVVFQRREQPAGMLLVSRQKSKEAIVAEVELSREKSR